MNITLLRVVQFTLLAFLFTPQLTWGGYCSAGNIVLSTQQEVDDFQATYGGGGVCDKVSGSLDIIGNNITNLDALIDLTYAQGLRIDGNASLANINGLANLSSVYFSVWIRDNPVLTDLAGLIGLASIGNDLLIRNNSTLTGLTGLNNLTSVGDSLNIDYNPILTNIGGLESLTSVGGSFGIGSNEALTNIDGLANLTSVGGSLNISLNPTLFDLDGLTNLTSAGGVEINSNDNLTDLDGLANLTSLEGSLALFSSVALTNLSGLSNLSSIGGDLTIYNIAMLTDLAGLSNLSNLGGVLSISNNATLTIIDELTNLTSVGGVEIVNNAALPNINGLVNISSITNDLRVADNAALVNVDGLANLVSVGGGVSFQNNNSLLNLDGLARLTNVGGFLRIWGDLALTNLDGLVSLRTVGDYLTIQSNYSLGNCEALAPLLGWSAGPPNDNVVGVITIGSDNATGCKSVQEILGSVSGPTAPDSVSVNVIGDQVTLTFSAATTTDTLWPILNYYAQCLSDEQFSSENGTVLDIPDLDSMVSTINLSGVPFQNAAGLNITVNITHPRTRHLTLALMSPVGTQVLLWDEAVGDGANLVGTFPTTLEPAESLSAFDGEDFNGDWQLTVTDGVASYTGTLNSWAITIGDKITATSEASPITLLGLADPQIYTCTVSANTGLGVGPASTAVSTDTFTVGGFVAGLAKGESVILQNNNGDDLEISTNGSFTFATPMFDGSTYSVSVLIPPPCPSATCIISNGSGTLSSADVTDVRIELGDGIFGDGFEDPHNTITKVDNQGDVGEYTSLAIGTDGFPVISYFSRGQKALKVTKCNDVACTGNDETVSTVDDPDNELGGHTSLAIGTDGFPIISYFDQTALALKVAKCNDIACTGGDETITSIDDVGGRSSITIGTDDMPIISYFDLQNGRLKVAKCNDVACADNDELISIVDDPDNEVGQYNSIAIGDDGMPVISYVDSSAGAIKVAKCNDVACEGQDESISTIDGPYDRVNSLQYISIVIGSDYLPVMSYFDIVNGTLKVAKCDDSACTGGGETITTVDDPVHLVGAHSAIAISADGWPIIAYHDTTALSLKVAKCNDYACAGNDEVITTVDDSEIWTGTDNSIAIGIDGLPVISYHSQTAWGLYIMHCGLPSCVP